MPPACLSAARVALRLSRPVSFAGSMVPTSLLWLAMAGAMLPAAAQQRGYQPRACGLDMNRNGIVGEAQDCHVCDGRTTDPDFDGVAEDLIYVDAGSGADTATCGSPSSPCRTLSHAWGTRADGPGDGAEDIICAAGVFRTEEHLGPAFSGLDGYYQVAPTGSQSRAWQYPRNPTMLVGWDRDDDGRYPPFDTDDVAVLDGGPNGLSQTFLLGESNLEIAHLTIRDYGGSSAPDTGIGLVKWGSGTISRHHHFLHDLETHGINRAKPKTSSVIFASFFGGMQNWIQFKNVLAAENGGYWMRGAGADSGPVKGPVRIENVTRTSLGCNYSACGDGASSTGFKLWGQIDGIEILDSIWDANVAAWQPKPSGGPPGALFVDAAQCSRDWVIRNNEIMDHKHGLLVQPYASGACEVRSVTGVAFDRNVFRNRYGSWVGIYGVHILSGIHLGTTAEDVSVTNNSFSSTVGVGAWIRSAAGNDQGPNPGTIRILNNTFHGPLDSGSSGTVTIAAEDAHPQQRYEVKNNIFASSSGEVIRVEFSPSGWQSNYNTFSGGNFRWNGSAQTLGGWRSVTGSDQASKGCQPSFVNPGGGDLHLASSDTCARDSGTALSPMVMRDLDGDSRPGGCAWDIGADERQESCSGGSEPTPGSARFSASSYSGSEGQSVTISIQRSAGSDGAASVRVVTANGTATAGSDFAEVSQTVSWANGDATTRTLQIPLLADQSVEGSETFTVRLGDASGVSLGSPSTATATITDTTSAPDLDPGSARLGSTGYSGAEGTAVAITVQRVGGSDGTGSVRVVSAGGTASSGSDFTSISQTVSWADGEATSKTVQVQLLTDQSVESTESFTVRLESAIGVDLGSPASATVSITDATSSDPDPAGEVNLSSSVLAGREGGLVQVTVERVDGSVGAASVRVSTANGSATAPGDFTAMSQTLSWGDGDSSPKSLTIELVDDALDEGQESFYVRLDQATGAALGSPSAATVAIEDATPSESPPASVITFELDSVSVSEGNTVRVKLRREGSSEGSASVRYYTVEGSAKAGSDFAATSSEVMWSSGSSAVQQITVATIEDSVHEPAESFAIVLAAPTGGATLGRMSTVFATIEDDDAATSSGANPSIRLVAASEAVGEGDGALEVLLERTGDTSGPAAVDVSTLAGSARSNQDFVPVTETVRWNSREEGIKTVTIQILQDDESEGEETFQVRLARPWRATISGPTSATVTIHDDEIISLDAVTVAQGAESPTLSARSDNRLAVLWQDPGAATQASIQLFGETGQPLGERMPIGEPDRTIREPAAAFDQDEGLGLAWLESNPHALGNLVVARRASVDDPAGGQRLVLANTSVSASDLAVAADGYGRFLVTWKADGRIHFRAFDETGALPLVSNLTAANRHQVDVGLGGETVLVLEIAQSIALQRYDRHGAPVGALAPLTLDVPSHRPDVAVAADGRFVVVWQAESGNRLTGKDVFGQVFDASGVPEGAVFRVNTSSAGDQTRPRVDANDSGDFAVTWVDDREGRVLVRFFGASGEAVSGDVEVASVGGLGKPTEPRVAVADDDDTTVLFSLAEGAGSSIRIRTFGPRMGVGDCRADEEHVCLGGGRFRVSASWKDRTGIKAPGAGSALTADTGTFWFLDPANVELVIKTLDGCGVNQHRWVFAAGLTDVEVTLQVDDTVTGDSRTYLNREGRSFVPVRDPRAFAECDPQSSAGLRIDDLVAFEPMFESWGASAPADCGSTIGLCLGGGRFRVEASWQQGAAGGPAESVPLTSDSGYFWFFDRDNVELMVKVLDACGVNGRFWVFGGGLTDVGVALSVTDTWTGERIDYSSANGLPFSPILDTQGLTRACSAVAP